ncbi:MAG TPA: cupin domain-containing protein [Thermoplasmata archaeon]|nr:cupin domain-containing protein [Thermoplasmata archaeon]
MWVKPFRVPGKLNPPEARAISSSCVQLPPGASVGEHVTEGREELLFVFEGEATLRLAGTAAKIPAGHVAYVPNGTRHDVANEGPAALTYVYVTAKEAGQP